MKTDFVTMTTILKIYLRQYLKNEFRRVCNVGLQMKMILKGSEVELVNFMKTEPPHDLKFYSLNHQMNPVGIWQPDLATQCTKKV